MENLGLQIDKITKNFGEFQALKDISFQVPKGRTIGLLGQNGAGKSTLVRLLSGVMKPTSGTGKIHGYDLKTELNQVKSITGLLPEEYALYEKLSIFEYIEFLGSLYDMNYDLIESRFVKLATRLKLVHLRNRLIDTLSKGQKQKVALIAALIHEPIAVFLDEPLANLDVAAQRTVRDIIKEYRQDGRTIVIATHLLSNIENMCDYILLIDSGVIHFNGELTDFLQDGMSLEDSYLNFLGERVYET